MTLLLFEYLETQKEENKGRNLRRIAGGKKNVTRTWGRSDSAVLRTIFDDRG